MADYKSAYQLEEMIADLAGFDKSHVLVMAVGDRGDFRAEFLGGIPAVNPSRARSDVDAACQRLKTTFRLRI